MHNNTKLRIVGHIHTCELYLSNMCCFSIFACCFGLLNHASSTRFFYLYLCASYDASRVLIYSSTRSTNTCSKSFQRFWLIDCLKFERHIIWVYKTVIDWDWHCYSPCISFIYFFDIVAFKKAFNIQRSYVLKVKMKLFK